MNPYDKFASSGLRLTAPRKKILTLLADQKHPISFDEYTLLDPLIDKSTFYRTMQTFEALHIIRGIQSDEGKRYYELSESVHPHFICNTCHKIECLPPQPILSPAGYHVDSVIYKGQCSLCSAS